MNLHQINFSITSSDEISKAFQKREIMDFNGAVSFIRLLPYGRNANKLKLTTVFEDGCGTCSTKHALLKQLAIENGRLDIQLIMGLFKMNGTNTPEVAATLQFNKIEYIPEAHCYLKYHNQIIDCTKGNSNPENFIEDILEETEILPHQITDYKVAYHRDYLEHWLNKQNQYSYTLDEFWAIREQCIKDLSA